MQHPSILRIGTRKSALALAQADIVCQKLAEASPGLKTIIVPVVTSGDRHASERLADIGGKGLFVRELEESLISGETDIAVHSLKDMESHLAQGLTIAAVLERGDPRDALVTHESQALANLPKGARIGTSSPRRSVQLKILRPDLDIVPFRGNVTTRLTKLKDRAVDATILALAGLKRLGMESHVTEILDTEHFTPAAGQGVIAIECRESDKTLRQLLLSLQHPDTHVATLAERSLLAVIGGSCYTPLAGYAWLEAGQLHMRAMIAAPDGSQHVSVTRADTPTNAAAMGKDAAQELLARGGRQWLCP
jgi:hydroxymethylbilane synthase